MPWTNSAPILIWAILFIPFATWLLLYIPKTKLLAFVLYLGFVAFNLFWMLTVNWSFVNYYLRLLPVFAGLIILARWLIHHLSYRSRFFPQKSSAWLGLAAAVLFLAGAVWVDSRAIAGQRYDSFSGKAMVGLLPLRAGLFVITNGGDAIDGLWMNNYLKDWMGRDTGADPSLAYAMDFAAIYQDTGRTSEKLNPKISPDYEIHNKPAYSPCMGEVVYVEDGHPDVDPMAPGWEMGNFVVVQCEEYFVTLSNLRHGTFYVKPGDFVTFNAVLANVGNSADRTIPHLHMHVTVGGWEAGSTPVPVTFDTTSYEFAARARNHLFAR